MSSKKNHGPAPVPPGNRAHAGPPAAPGHPADDQPSEHDANGNASFQEQDPKRRLGDFSGAGEHPIQQPGRLNDGDTHSK